MRLRLVITVIVVALLAACSGGGLPSAQPSAASAGASTGGQPNVSVPAGNGTVDCAAITTAAQELIMVQFLAQLKTPDAVASVKTHQIGNLDLDKFLAAMHTLHALDGHAGVLGDPKAAIDFYEKAGKAAQVLFATSPMTQAAIDTYNNDNVGTLPAFLGHQAAISAAMGEVGC
jgi:hypothetical protein